jgi:putative ABC transport system permease protein
MAALQSALRHKSIGDVVRRKAQTFLVVVAILIPVAGVTAIGVASSTLSDAYAFTLAASGSQAQLRIVVDHLDPTLVPILARQPNILGAQLDTILDTQWHVATAPGHVALHIIGYPDPRQVPLTPLQLVAGGYPGPAEIVMDYGDQALGASTIGQQIELDSATGSVSLRVVGLARTPGQNPATSGQAIAYMSATALDQIPAFPFSATAQREPFRAQELSFHLRDPAAYASTVQELDPRVRTAHATVLGVLPPDKSAPLHQMTGILVLARVLLVMAVALAALMVGAAVAALVSEQAPSIGILKTLGATRSRIIRHYSVTALAFGFIATPLGLIVGVICGAQLAAHMTASIPLAPAPLDIPAGTVILAAAIGLVLPLLAAWVPIQRASRNTVRAVLSSWSVTNEARAHAKGRTLRLPRVPQTAQIGVRALTRRPWRSALSVLTIAIAAVAFLVVQSVTASVQQSVQSVWGNFHADVEVYVGGDTSYRQVTAALAHVPNIARVERVGWYGSQTPWGKVGVWGTEPNSQLHHAAVRTGRWFTHADTHTCLVSTDLAAKAGLRTGSTLDIPGPNGARTIRFTVIGTVDEPVDDLSQIGTIDMPVNDLYLLEGAPTNTVADYTNRVLIQARDRSTAAVDLLTRAIDTAGRQSGADRGGPIAEVFRFHDEVVRHQRSFEPIEYLLLAVSAVVALVGLLGLADSLTASVSDQRRDIGVVRALGGRASHLATMFWTEAIAISLAAWAVAAAVGVPLAYIFVQLFRKEVMPTDFHFDPVSIVLMVAVTSAIATAATVLPAIRAAALRPRDLLRGE